MAKWMYQASAGELLKARNQAIQNSDYKREPVSGPLSLWQTQKILAEYISYADYSNHYEEGNDLDYHMDRIFSWWIEGDDAPHFEPFQLSEIVQAQWELMANE